MLKKDEFDKVRADRVHERVYIKVHVIATETVYGSGCGCGCVCVGGGGGG